MKAEAKQEEDSLVSMAQLFVDYADNIYTVGKISTCEYRELINTKIEYLGTSYKDAISN